MARHGGRAANSVRNSHTSSTHGSQRKPIPREVLLSKKVSWVLRHGAAKERLKLDENGYANCGELLSWQPLRSLQVTFPELRTMVSTNDKQRFQLAPIPVPSPTSSSDAPTQEAPITPDLPSAYLIRASQGHSLPIASSAFLTPILPTDSDFPEEVVHGTYSATWPKILASGGLRCMGRTHVHFATGIPESNLPSTSTSSSSSPALRQLDPKPNTPAKENIISGMRRDANLMIWVSVRRSIAGGLKWWRSANGVVLSEGDEKRFIATEWIERAVRRSDGMVIWKRDS